MTRTLNDILLSMAEFALPKQSGAAESGTTTTLVDTVFKQSPGLFTSGIIFFRTGTYTGQYAAIALYDGTTGTFTFPALAGGGIVAGVQYEAFGISAGENLYDMIAAINQALRDMGNVLKFDEALVTVADQEDYTLPAGVSDVKNIWIADNTAAPYDYRPHRHWNEIDGGKIRFHTGYIPRFAGQKIRLEYLAAHDILDTYADAVHQSVNWNWLKYKAIVNLVRSLGSRGKAWDEFKNVFEEAQARLSTLRPRSEPVVSVQAA